MLATLVSLEDIVDIFLFDSEWRESYFVSGISAPNDSKNVSHALNWTSAPQSSQLDRGFGYN